MNKAKFKINGKENYFDISGSPEFKYGEDVVLSNEDSDICFNQPWYKLGYQSTKFFDLVEFEDLKTGITNSIKKIIENKTGINTDGFKLEKYHNWIKSDKDHLKVVSKTRDLFPENFNFPINKLIPKFSKALNIELTDIEPNTKKQMHIIVRINRPKSSDYNPAHKDIYESYDGAEIGIGDHVDHYTDKLKFINLWIPIAGVTENSSLPVAPSSHLISENQILRTTEGSVIEGNKYRVRMVKKWGSHSSLIRPKVSYGEVLIFSSHLIHGLATNEESGLTRVSLEFRLFKK